MEPAGERLKKIRLEKGIALEEVQKKTKIHLNILKAIEGEGLTNLSPVYLKGFLKIYCKSLGVDPKEYIDDYKEPAYKLNEKINQKKVRVESDKPLFKFPSIKFPSLRLNKKLITIFVCIIIIVFLWLILFNLGKFIASKPKRSKKNSTRSLALSQLKSNNKVMNAEKVQSAAVPSQSKIVQTVPPKEAISDIRLGIRSHENCWVSLKIDGKLVFQKVLEKGRFESWQAKNKMELSLGNAGVVELEVNGQVFSNLGRKGMALKNILITKEGLKIGR